MILIKLCFVQNLSVTAKAERFSNGSSLRLNPPVTYGDSPPNSGALGREITFDGRGEQQQTTMYNRKVSGFARGSPTRATTTTAASGGNREELLGQRPAGRECKTLHEADAGSRNPDAGERSETEGFNVQKISRFRLEPGDFFSLDFYDARSQKTVTRVLPP